MRVTDSDFANHAVSGGFATPADLAEISTAFTRWANRPNGFWAWLNGEVVAHAPHVLARASLTEPEGPAHPEPDHPDFEHLPRRVSQGCARLTHVSDTTPEPQLNAAQQEVIDRLGRPPSECPSFDPDLATRLRDELENRLAGVVEKVDPVAPLFIGKRVLAGVFGCEASFLHDEEQLFAWNPPMATGAVAHKAIELGINWRSPDPAPAELVDAALDSLTRGDSGLADWLYRLRRRRAGRPAQPRRQPGVQPSGRAGHRCYPSGARRPSHVAAWSCAAVGSNSTASTTSRLGRADGQRAGKVIVDLKTGRRHLHQHREDPPLLRPCWRR